MYRAHLSSFFCREVHRAFRGGELARRLERGSRIRVRESRFCSHFLNIEGAAPTALKMLLITQCDPDVRDPLTNSGIARMSQQEIKALTDHLSGRQARYS